MFLTLEDVIDDTCTPDFLAYPLGLYFTHTGILTPHDIVWLRRLLIRNHDGMGKVLTINITNEQAADHRVVLGLALMGKIMADTEYVIVVPFFKDTDSDNVIPVDHPIYSCFYQLPTSGFITSNMAELDFDFSTTPVTVKPILGFANPHHLISMPLVEERERFRNDTPMELTDEDVTFLISKQTDVPTENVLKTQLQVGTLYIAKTIISTGGICGIKEEPEYGLSVYYEFGGVIPLSFSDGLSQHYAKKILTLMARNHSLSRMMERETFEVDLTGRDPATVRPFDIPE